jgi:hypothetical protein
MAAGRGAERRDDAVDGPDFGADAGTANDPGDDRGKQEQVGQGHDAKLAAAQSSDPALLADRAFHGRET